MPKNRLPDFLTWYLHPKICRNIFPIFFEMVFLPKTSVAQSLQSPDFLWKEMGFFPDLETLHIYLFASYDRSPKSGLMIFGGVYLSIDCLMFIVTPPDDGFTEIVYHLALAHYSIEPNVIFYFHIYYLYITYCQYCSVIVGYTMLHIKIQQENQKEVVGHSHFLLGTYILSFFLCSNCWSYKYYNVGFTQFHKPFPSGYGSKPWYPKLVPIEL